MRGRERVGEMKGTLYIMRKEGVLNHYYYYVLYMWSYMYIHACMYNPE